MTGFLLDSGMFVVCKINELGRLKMFFIPIMNEYMEMMSEQGLRNYFLSRFEKELEDE